MKKTLSVIFFDIYQTLLDTKIPTEESEKIAGWKAFVKELQKYGIIISANDFYQIYKKQNEDFYSTNNNLHIHHNLQTLITTILEKDFNLKLPPEEIGYLLYTYRRASRGWVHLYPHVSDVLSTLSNKYILSTASYTQGSYTQYEIRELNIERFFSHFIYSSDIGILKKSPEFYKHALTIVGKKAEECIMVGDNYNTDVLIPQQIGIRSIWIKNPITSDDYPMKHDPPNTLTLEQFDQLPKRLEEGFSPPKNS